MSSRRVLSDIWISSSMKVGVVYLIQPEITSFWKYILYETTRSSKIKVYWNKKSLTNFFTQLRSWFPDLYSFYFWIIVYASYGITVLQIIIIPPARRAWRSFKFAPFLFFLSMSKVGLPLMASATAGLFLLFSALLHVHYLTKHTFWYVYWNIYI